MLPPLLQSIVDYVYMKTVTVGIAAFNRVKVPKDGPFDVSPGEIRAAVLLLEMRGLVSVHLEDESTIQACLTHAGYKAVSDRADAIVRLGCSGMFRSGIIR